MPYMQNPDIVMAPARTLANIVMNDQSGRNLALGYSLGSDLASQIRRRKMQQALGRAAGEGNQSRVMSLLAEYDPRAYVSALDEARKQQQLSQGLDLARQFLSGSAGQGNLSAGESGSGSGPSNAALGLAMLGAATGNPAYGQIGGMINQYGLEDYKRGREWVEGIDASGRPVRVERRALDQGQQPFTPPAQYPQSNTGGELPDIGQYQQNPNFSDALAIARTYNIDPKIWMSLIQKESGWNPGAKSGKGAIGLTQIMPETAQRFGVRNPSDPIQNLSGGAKYFRYLLNRYDNNYVNALAAYNAGEGAVDKYGGIPPYEETKNYVRSILQDSRRGGGYGGGPGAIAPQQRSVYLPAESGGILRTPGGAIVAGLPPQEKSYHEASGSAAGRFPYEQAEKELAVAREIQSSYRLAEEKSRAAKNIEMSERWQKDSENSTQALQFIQDMRSLVEQGVADTSKLSPLKGLIGEWLYASGYADTSNPLVQRAAQNRQWESIATQLTMNLLGGRLGAQISDADREFIKNMMPKITDNPATAQGILERLQKAFSRSQEKNNAWLDMKTQNPNLRETDFEQQWQKHLQQMWKQEAPPPKSGGPTTFTNEDLVNQVRRLAATGVRITPQELKQQLEAKGLKYSPPNQGGQRQFDIPAGEF